MYVKGYRIVDIPLFKEKFGGSFHSLYIKEHSDRVNKEGNGRTLFVGNVDYNDVMTNEEIDGYLRLLLSRFGDINSISVSSISPDQSINARFAHVEFSKKSSLKSVLNANTNELFEASNEGIDNRK